jgi:hypothetical protein
MHQYRLVLFSDLITASSASVNEMASNSAQEVDIAFVKSSQAHFNYVRSCLQFPRGPLLDATRNSWKILTPRDTGAP